MRWHTVVTRIFQPLHRSGRLAGLAAMGFWAAYALLVASPRAATALELTPDHLSCQQAVNPVGIDAPRPHLSWVVVSDRRGARQTAYQILAATAPELLAVGKADLWDSGRVASDETLGIAYAGKPLESSQAVFWTVRVWDDRNRESPFAAPARWITGILTPEGWQGKWIARQATPGQVSPSLPMLRKSFTVDKPLRRAVVHLCALGHGDLLLDGRPVDHRLLDPPWSVYEKTAYYVSFDVTKQLSVGRHALGVMLGKGFYNTAGDRRVHGVNSNRPLKMILQADLFFADGTRQSIVSDKSWRTADGPITHSAILGGEDYDARREIPGWYDPGFDDSAWTAAVETAGPGGRLTAACSPPLGMDDFFAPARIDEPAPGIFVYDFGQNASAIPRLAVRGKAGQVVRLTPAEQRHGMSPRRNDGRGLVNPAGVGTPNYWHYTLRGGKGETWQPQFNYSGFQDLQVEGAVPEGRPNPEGKPVVHQLVSWHVRNNAERTGKFSCSNALWNATDRGIDWAVRSNLSHVLTDCPHREKLGWLEVSYLMGPSIAGRYDIARFYSKVSRDCGDSQRADGMVPTVAPSYPAFSAGFAYTPEWGAAAVVVPWQVYLWYGDRDVLDQSYPTMRAFVDYLRKTSKDLVPEPGLGDWYDYGHGKPAGPSQFTPPELSAMATFCRCARIVADTAGVLGRAGDRARYEALASDVAKRFHQIYFDGKAEYKNHGSPQTANSMALVAGIVPEPLRPAVFARIVADLEARKYQQTAGDIGYWYLLQTLAANGRSDLIARMISRTEMGSYGFIVNNLWTAMPEAWDANTGASMNHCMLGHIQEWFTGSLVGIRPDPQQPGFRRVVIDPHPVAQATWAAGSLDTVRGKVESRWTTADGGWTHDVVVPANTKAFVFVPAVKVDDIAEGGRPLPGNPHVTLLRFAAGRAVLEVNSGTYRFTSTLPGKER